MASDPAAFDLQAHRGGLGLVVENTMAAFRNAVAIGVTTLECDVHISADGVAMVTHDRILDPKKIKDTAPAHPGDSEFPYVGRFITRLSREQLATLDCGSLTSPDHPGQLAVPFAPMPTFEEVLTLAKVNGLRVNVETKFEAVAPEETSPRERFIEVVLRQIEHFEMTDAVMVQSFDWLLLRQLGWADPRIRRAALVSPRTMALGKPGPSAWLGGIDLDDRDGDPISTVSEFGFDVISPDKSAVTADFVRRAHESGVEVIPYTVDDPALMVSLVEAGVDGFITNYPDRARLILDGPSAIEV